MSEQAPTKDLFTPKGIRVEIGQVWRDCDVRMSGGNRKCRVVEINHYMDRVRMQNIHGPVPATWVSVRRMYKHSTGWELVS